MFSIESMRDLARELNYSPNYDDIQPDLELNKWTLNLPTYGNGKLVQNLKNNKANCIAFLPHLKGNELPLTWRVYKVTFASLPNMQSRLFGKKTSLTFVSYATKKHRYCTSYLFRIHQLPEGIVPGRFSYSIAYTLRAKKETSALVLSRMMLDFLFGSVEFSQYKSVSHELVKEPQIRETF